MQSTWSRVLNEISDAAKLNPAASDNIRRHKIQAVEKITQRPLVIYVTAWTSPGKYASPDLLQLDFSDKTGFKDVTEQLTGSKLDVLIHSPGGLAEAAQAVVEILRDRFEDIRFIIPQAAKSAATMLALSGNSLLMDEVSELGPIDPQMPVYQGGGVKYSPADAIIAQFEKAYEDIQKNPGRLSIWVPIIAQMGPSLLKECENAKTLSLNLVKEWLANYMFKEEAEAESKADRIAKYFGDHKTFLSHSKRINIVEAQKIGLKVEDYRSNPKLRDAIWELYCAADIVLANTPACKIIENSKGHAVVKNLSGPQLVLQPNNPRK